MGNDISPASKMGIASIAVTTANIETRQMIQLLHALKNISNEKNSEFITREEMDESMKKLNLFEPSDFEIFIRLFTLFDLKGDNTVNYKDYICGITGCLTTAPLTEKIATLISIYDTDSTQMCSKVDLKRLLTANIDVASFFGDPVLSTDQISNIVMEIFTTQKLEGGKVKCDDCIASIMSNSTINKFMNGEGKIRYSINSPVE